MTDLVLIFVALTATALGFGVRHYLSSYFSEKGKNAATKQDISAITEKIEEIRSTHLSNLEKLKVELGILARKHDILLDEKIRVFKELQKKLVSFKRYCEAAFAEHGGTCSEFHPRLEGLSKEDNKSTLTHLTDLHYLEQENIIFFSESARQTLEWLHNKMSLMCSMELALLGEDIPDDIKKSAPNTYEEAMKQVDECLQELYQDLQMPTWSATPPYAPPNSTTAAPTT